jgi:hypothetical protein
MLALPRAGGILGSVASGARRIGAVSMAEYLEVLVLCADPVNLVRTLNLAQELVHFEHVIRGAVLPVRMRRLTPSTLEQLTREFALAQR